MMTMTNNSFTGDRGVLSLLSCFTTCASTSTMHKKNFMAALAGSMFTLDEQNYCHHLV
jgi:hypothetical protein